MLRDVEKVTFKLPGCYFIYSLPTLCRSTPWSLLTVNAFPYNLLSVTKKLIFKKLFQTNPLSQKLTVKFILTLFCNVFRQYFAVKQGKCSTTVAPFCSNYQNNSTSSPGFLMVTGSITCNQVALLTSFWCHCFMTKFFPNLVNSSWLWWIMCVVLTNQKQGNIFEWIINIPLLRPLFRPGGGINNFKK